MHKFYKPFETSYAKGNIKIESELGGDNPVSYRSSRESMNNRLLGLRRRSILFALAAFLLVIFSSTVYAACVTPIENLKVTSNTVLCSGRFSISDGDNNGAIIVDADNVVLDCNGATLIGTGNTKSKGIYTNNKGVTVKNCNIQKYGSGIALETGYNGQGDYIIQNNSVTDIHGTGIYASGKHTIITNNKVSCYYNGDYNEWAGIHVEGTSDTATIDYNNIVGGCNYGIKVSYNFDNVVIKNNKISNNDRGIVVADSSDIQIKDNYLKNNTNDVDGYGLCMNILQTNTENNPTENIYISGNTCDELTSGGIAIQKVKDITITGNTFNFVSFNSRNKYLSSDVSSPPCAVIGTQVLKGWYSNYFDTSPSNTIAQLSWSTSSNVKMTKNTFNSNTQCYAFFQAVTNFQHDFSNYWYRSFQAPTYLLNKTEIYIPNNIDIIQHYTDKISNRSYFKYGNVIGKGYTPNTKFYYTISKKLMILDNTNYENKVQQLKIFNLSKAYPYNDVYDPVAKKVLSANADYFEITLQPGQIVWVGNYTSKDTPKDTPQTNNPPIDPIVSIASKDSTVNNDINCAAYIYDTDSNILNVTLLWYKNDVLSKTVNINNQKSKTTVSDILPKSNLKIEDTWYCKVRITDGNKYSSLISSSKITVKDTVVPQTNVPPVVNSISTYSYDSTVDNDILCMLKINDANNDLMTVTVHWYKNGIFDRAVTLYSQKSGDIVSPLNKDQLSAGDTWQCRSRGYDGKTYGYWWESNIVTIGTVPAPEPETKPVSEPRKSSGGGGGGGSSRSTSPIQLAAPVVVQESIVEEPTTFENSQSDDASIAITTQSFDIAQEPVQEENSMTGNVVLEDTQPGNSLSIILFGVMISGLLVFTYRKQIVITTDKYLPVVREKVVFTKDKIIPVVAATTDKVVFIVKKHLAVKTDQKVVYYMLKKLNDGYSYDAIGEVLKKKKYSDRSIKYHTKVLMANGYQPFIKYPGPQNYSIPQSKKAKLFSDIQEYTRIHIHEGFRLDDIKKVLLYNGHPWDIIEEAIHG